MVTGSGLMRRYLGAAWVVIVLSAIGFTLLAFDRDPPIVSVSYTTQPARPGETAFINAQVKRDLSRNCEAQFSRFFIDSSGARFDVTPMTYTTAKGMRAFDKASTDLLRLPVKIPDGAAPGKARFIIPLAYTCNIIHNIKPIDVVLEYEFEVLP